MSEEDHSLEIEAKYTLAEASQFERLLEITALGDYELHSAGEQQLVDHYLDTPDHALRRGGYACRLRQKNGGWLVTIKSLGGADPSAAPGTAVHQREEYEWPVESEVGAKSPQDWPEGPGRDRVLPLAGEQALVELFVVRQQRSLRALWHGPRLAAEVCLDRVQVEQDRRRSATCEVEVELRPDGTLADLEASGQALQALGARPEPRSKYERAVALFGGLAEEILPESPPSPRKRKLPGVRADLPMAEAGRLILQLHFERMLAQEAGTRQGDDIEALHDMRVATRRQRAAFRLFKGYFRPKAIRSFRLALRALGERLGAVRDLDVMIDAAQAYLTGLTTEQAQVFGPLLDEWRAQRDAARAELLAYLDGGDYRRFTEAYGAFVSTAGAGVRRAQAADLPQPHLVRHVLPPAVWDHYGAVRAYESVLPWAPMPTLHALRIEGKRLRYLLEFFREVLDPCVEAAIADLVMLQDHIGEMHDIEVNVGRMQAFLLRGLEAPLPQSVGRAVGGYLSRRQARQRILQRTLPRAWRKLNSARFRRLLGRALAAL